MWTFPTSCLSNQIYFYGITLMHNLRHLNDSLINFHRLKNLQLSVGK